MPMAAGQAAQKEHKGGNNGTIVTRHVGNVPWWHAFFLCLSNIRVFITYHETNHRPVGVGQSRMFLS